MDWHRYNVTLQFRYVQVRIKPIVTLYRIAFVPAQKLYRIRLLFTHENGDFGVFSVMERSCAARISKVEPVTYRIGVHTIPESFSCQHEKYSVSYEHSLNRRDTTPNKTTMHTHTHTNEQLRLPQEKEWRPVWGVVTRDDSQRRFLVQHSVTMLQQCCNHSKQCRNNVTTPCWAKNRPCE